MAAILDNAGLVDDNEVILANKVILERVTKYFLLYYFPLFQHLLFRIKTIWLFYKFPFHDEIIRMLPSENEEIVFSHSLILFGFRYKIIEETFINIYRVLIINMMHVLVMIASLRFSNLVKLGRPKHPKTRRWVRYQLSQDTLQTIHVWFFIYI